jgi:hypothetical protein
LGTLCLKVLNIPTTNIIPNIIRFYTFLNLVSVKPSLNKQRKKTIFIERKCISYWRYVSDVHNDKRE